MLFALNSFSQKKESITKCSASAYSRDDDPAGTNVRDSPKGKILTSIPSGAMFEIIGYSKGWFQITNVSYSAEDKAEAVKRGHKVKEGFVHLNGFVGWIYSERTEVNFEGKGKIDLYATPEYGDSIFTYDGDRIAPHRIIILSCQRDWLRIDFGRGEKKGWVDKYCSNSLSNCN
ncbi:SH3 domain protein [Leptospira interrogans serovar Hebdomadis str. R499]|nr:SH3 domain protein [Leptospira interrogans serovar Hebdomadis str. R499]